MRYKGLVFDTIFTFLCLLTAYSICTNSFINKEVAWHLEVAKRLLSGENYLSNLFDYNSPFVFAYYMPVVFIHNFLKTSPAKLIVIYVLMTSTLSLLLSYYILVKNLTKKALLKRILYYTLIFIVLFLPAPYFGQKETILVTLLFPYFLILLFSNSNPTSTQKSLNCGCAVLAGFALMQNPLYIILPLCLDIYCIAKDKRFHIHQLILYLTIIFATLLTYSVYPEYFHTITRLTWPYVRGFDAPLINLLVNNLSFLIILLLMIVIINIKNYYQYNSIMLTWIAVVSTFIIYLYEGKFWYYHIFPMLAFGMVLLSLIIIKYYSKNFSTAYKENFIDIFNFGFNFCLALAIMIYITVIIVFNDAERILYFYDQNSAMNHWISYSKDNFKNRKLYFFVSELYPAYTLSLYTNIKIVSPWSNTWLIPYILKQNVKKNNYNLEKDMKVFYNLAIEGFINSKPDFVIIDRRLNDPYLQSEKFNYLDFFSRNKNFMQALNDYSFYTSVEGFFIYKKK